MLQRDPRSASRDPLAIRVNGRRKTPRGAHRDTSQHHTIAVRYAAEPDNPSRAVSRRHRPSGSPCTGPHRRQAPSRSDSGAEGSEASARAQMAASGRGTSPSATAQRGRASGTPQLAGGTESHPAHTRPPARQSPQRPPRLFRRHETRRPNYGPGVGPGAEFAADFDRDCRLRWSTGTADSRRLSTGTVDSD